MYSKYLFFLTRFHLFRIHQDPQDDHSGGRKRCHKRPKTAKKRRFTAVIRHSRLWLPFPVVSCYETTIFLHRISIHFWNDGLRRRINAVFCRVLAVSGRLRTVPFDLGQFYLFMTKIFKQKSIKHFSQIFH
jgi:hypothetical protein